MRFSPWPAYIPSESDDAARRQDVKSRISRDSNLESPETREEWKGRTLAPDMEIALIGISHHTASIELRERLAFRVEQACEAADQLRARGILKEVVVLSTCNRTEVYGVAREHSSDNLPAMEMFIASYHRLAPADLSAVVYRHSDRSVVRH